MSTNPPLITGVDFVTVASSDLDKSRRFYGEVLGLRASKTWGESDPAGAEFETGNLTVALMDSTKLGIEVRPSNHPIEFRVEDFEAARAELESRGVEFKGDVLDSGVCKQAFFEDPDGHLLAIHHRYAPQG